MMGWCEAEEHDLDDDKTEGDFYMVRGESPVDDRFIFLCEEHKP